ncbi:MAG TPA: fused MFS/spermidine synthase, partial [Deferrimonas sp.]
MGAIPAGHKGIIYLIFSLSGFCALIYEILWTKHLSLTFGTTMIAVSIVAAVFMAGLALGSYLLGKYSDHETNLLRIYAFLELGIAIFALLFPPTLKVVTYVHAALGQLAPGLPGLSHFGQLGFSALLLLPPTVCMGGTFPLMCRFFARKKSGGHIGRLYAMNTVGAALGAFLAGYVLIPQLGLSATNLLAVLINLSIAAVSWQFSRRIGHTPAADVSRATRADQLELARTHRPVLIAIALIGFFSLGYEILWTRVFLLFLGNTSYAFSLMLSSYLIGIALGGALYARLVHPDFDEKKLFVRLVVLMGLSILVTVPFYDQLPHLFQWAHEASGERWWH